MRSDFIICLDCFTFNFGVKPEDNREMKGLGSLEFEEPKLGHSCD